MAQILTFYEFRAMVAAVTSENQNGSQDPLHQMLAEAELRRDAELQQHGKKGTYFFLLGLVLLLTSFGLFLMLDHSHAAKTSDHPLAAHPGGDSATNHLGQLQSMIEGGAGANKSTDAKENGGLLNKDDIQFAKNIMTFGMPSKQAKAK